MNRVKSGILFLLLSSLTGCGQQLVEFIDLGGGNDDMSAGGNDLAGRDLGNTNTDGGGGDGSQSQPPMVMSVTPSNLATGVPTFRKPTATFNKAMDPASIDTSSFTLKEQGAVQLLAGSVIYVAATNTATFKPASALLVDTTYVATITTVARDTFGTPLGTNYTWSFTTGTQACGMTPVFLGAAGNFGVLAGAMITNSGPTIINGDIGVSPGTAIVGFGAGPGVAGPGTVNGSQHSADTAAAQGIGDLTTAYNDAAGRSLCFVTIASGELGGLTITPGLYRSGISSFDITASDLTLDAQGDPDAVFIFQTSTSTLNVHNGRAVVLAGGAKASNVFWSVGTSATIGTTAIVKGTILADQSITIGTGATIDGRALARIAQVTMLSNSITVPAP
ncbi:MAG: hypothetical protein JWN44_655 [Myxococcales bacterium]|nr:hypothetical protein [Myxococcales bacterium]